MEGREYKIIKLNATTWIFNKFRSSLEKKTTNIMYKMVPNINQNCQHSEMIPQRREIIIKTKDIPSFLTK